MTVSQAGLTVEWLGYATARIEWPDGTVAYTDPGRYGVLTGEWTPGDFEGARHHPPASDYHAQDADVVVVTHAHHYDPHGIERVASEDATIVVYDGVSADDTGRSVASVDALDYDVRRVECGDEPTVSGVAVESVPAETAPDEPGGTSSHPPGFGCGFVLTHGDTAVFYPGDSDALAAHRDLDPEVFLAPISRRITMGETEAVDLAERLDPELVVPVHYNTFERLAGDSRLFACDVASRGIPVALDE
ncbi:MBL fold metallo-hydrolase [Halobacterium rubrum]|uniref:MBL fold metallo-hydrolase n=1 Tax=Halobacterium TaxID=2239 RepID=UPI001F2D3FA5|nr:MULTISPECIES: MBL fold metallo-hydrolase [Halobacterium]MDH5021068.1 MBL fold metallo-hydrolase [Halobacterium rubrum]